MNDRQVLLKGVELERERQEILWGDQSSHSDEKWLAILVEEVGEAANSLLEDDKDNLITELIQVAAVTLQWMEALTKRYGAEDSPDKTT